MSMKEKILILHSVSDVEVMVAVRAFKFRSRPPSFIHYFRGCSDVIIKVLSS